MLSEREVADVGTGLSGCPGEERNVNGAQAARRTGERARRVRTGLLLGFLLLVYDVLESGIHYRDEDEVEADTRILSAAAGW